MYDDDLLFGPVVDIKRYKGRRVYVHESSTRKRTYHERTVYGAKASFEEVCKEIDARAAALAAHNAIQAEERARDHKLAEFVNIYESFAILGLFLGLIVGFNVAASFGKFFGCVLIGALMGYLLGLCVARICYPKIG
jgi:p-aminobenzoyl-glutamate transporter AbgT